MDGVNEVNMENKFELYDDTPTSKQQEISQNMLLEVGEEELKF